MEILRNNTDVQLLGFTYFLSDNAFMFFFTNDPEPSFLE